MLSTGRGYCVVHKEQLGGIRFDYAITCNGACVVDKNGTIVAEHPLTNEEMYALVDFCEDYNYPLQFNYRDAYYAYCEYDALKGFYDAMPKSGLTCLDGGGSGPPPHRYAPCGLRGHAAAGAGPFQREVRPPEPPLHAGGRRREGRLVLLRRRARRDG